MADIERKPGRARFGQRAAACVLAGAAILALAQLLHASFCSLLCNPFNWDYPRYFNAIWNTAHGDWFRTFANENYLRTHLSFSLAALAPILRIWDHPFALAAIQWLLILAGGVLLGVTARRSGLSTLWALALVLFFWGYPFTESTQLNEFHGVAGYLLLVPWLYYCLLFRKGAAWVPLALILGLREDAAFMVLPLLLYFARAGRWKAGYAYAAAAALYGLAAMVLLYGVIEPSAARVTNVSHVQPVAILESLSITGDGLWVRLQSMAWILLPALPLLLLKPAPLLVIPSVAVVISLASGKWEQYSLAHHYAAVVMAFLAVAMLEAARRWIRDGRRPAPDLAAWLPAYLVVATALGYYWEGNLRGSREPRDEFRYIDPVGIHGLWVAQHAVPRGGVLLTSAEMSMFVANRRDILTPESLDEADPDVDVALLDSDDAKYFEYLDAVRRGEFGVCYFDGSIWVLKRGADTAGNAEALALAAAPSLALERSTFLAGRNVVCGGAGVVRYWEGQGSKGPATVACGSSVVLKPGHYRAVFRLQAATPEKRVRNTWGRLSVHRPGEEHSLAEAEIAPVPGEFRFQSLAFRLESKGSVEPRVTGGDAALWLDQVFFVQVDPEGP